MTTYLIRRLLLLPFTVFCILLLNFFIINLAPGDPSSTTEISDSGEANKSEEHTASHSLSDPYFYFREFYGLTLPIFFNTWPWISYEEVLSNLHQLLHHNSSKASHIFLGNILCERISANKFCGSL